MRQVFVILLVQLVISMSPLVFAADNPQIPASVSSNKVWFPDKDSPKLSCPQWVGDDGVDCVIVLAIDDMRDPPKYEAYLRPILQRLKAIDGRAPVSIMTCAIKPDDPQLQSWLQEGLSLECHTYAHPCPLLVNKDFATAKGTYDKCIDLLAEVPNSKPVAFRTPCCDSLNTVSPRFYTEIFNKTTPAGNFLQLDSSVFTVYTADDPSIPREWLYDSDGRETFRKYIPRKLERNKVIHDHFVNIIENYPYPFVIENLCWQFPCMVPSDWSANHLQKPNNPDTVRDLKRAIDITVKKQGVLNLVFHPHGWIKSEQVVDLIDHAVATHGRKVKFLNFHECLERLNKNLLGGRSLRDASGQDAGWRLVDLNRDGLMDVTLARSPGIRRTWDPVSLRWTEAAVTAPVASEQLPGNLPLPANTTNLKAGLRFVDLNDDEKLDVVFSNHEQYGAWLANSDGTGWTIELVNARRAEPPSDDEFPPIVRRDGSDNGFFVNQRELCWINEDTANLPDFLIRISFDKLLGDRIADAKSPSAAIKSMRVKPGYQIELVAHEPLTMDPVAFDWGPDGKFWIAEMADYPLGIDGHGAPGGRIRFLEDIDGDGKYDKSTLFLDKVPFPNGVIAWKKGVLVSAAPDVFYAEDTDGDGKADRRDVLFTGFVEGNQQHRANGFTRGLDNWLYLANGDSGGKVKSIKTDQILDLSGRDIRIRPDSGEMEAIAGASQFGRNRDDWDNWFGNNNSRPVWHFVLDDHYLRRNPHLAAPNFRRDVSVTPGAAPVFPSSRTMTRFNDFHTANRFTSACGAIVYRDELLFGNNLSGNQQPNAPDAAGPVSHTFVSEPVHNLVHHEVMTANGVSFTSQRAVGEEQSEFVSSTDNWFRPTMLRTGPDGSLWIADMYRLVIEHPQWIPIEWQRKLNVRAGEDKGRIWRVFPVGVKPRAIPRLDKLTVKELVEKLDSPNGWQRDLAQQLLIDTADPNAIPLLRDQAQQSANPLCRLHSLCTLAGLEQGLTSAVVSRALEDPHPGVRRHAIRLIEGFPMNHGSARGLCVLTHDPDSQVRLQLAYSAGEFADVGQPSFLLQELAIQAGNDPYQLAAIISSLNDRNLQQLLSEFVATSHDDLAPELIHQLLDQAAAFHNDAGLSLMLAVAARPDRDHHYQRWQYSAIEKLQNALNRNGSSLPQWIKGLTVSDKTLDDAKKAPDLLQTFLTSARALAIDPQASAEDRAAAVRVLGQSDELEADNMALISLLAPQEPPEIQAAVIGTLGRQNSPSIAAKLLERYRSFSPSLKLQTCDTLLRRETWRDELLTALEAKTISANDLDAATRQRLLADRSDALRERASRLLSVNLNTDRAKLVASYLAESRKGGDVQRGGELFKKTCSQCHKLGEVGHVVGPDLASLADKSAEVLLTAVFDPNRAVEARYLTFTAITKQGVTHTGIIASESASSVTLRAAEGKETTLLRSELDELQSNTKSLMPEGLEKDLKPADAAALVAYVRQNVPLPVMKSFPGNKPRLVEADAAGSLVLTPSDAEVYGSTIIIEEQHKNFGWWSSADDIVVWTINVPKAGLYSVSWTWACDPQAAGNSVAVEAAGKSLVRRVSKTAGWDDYQAETLGDIELPAGEVRFKVKPALRPLPALADVKSVVLKRKD